MQLFTYNLNVTLFFFIQKCIENKEEKDIGDQELRQAFEVKFLYKCFENYSKRKCQWSRIKANVTEKKL